MQKYDPRLSLAPRDIVARAIDNEMKNRGDDHVYLDVTHKDPEETKKHFPNIYEKCLSLGIDITKDYIPVAPAAHYLCGGIKVDLDARSSIDRLYAVGECSCTGLHGGNRLASNSLIEAVVYADAAAKHSLGIIDSLKYQENIPEWNDEGTTSLEEMVLITQSVKEVGQIMSTYVATKAGLTGMKIPLRYVCEMVCDRIAASQIYLGDRYTDASPWEYYERSRDHYLLHPETRALLEKLLQMVRDLGQERTFAYMKFLLGCEKDY